MAELLECCRDATGPERRHLRVMEADRPLCGTVARQDGAPAPEDRAGAICRSKYRFLTRREAADRSVARYRR